MVLNEGMTTTASTTTLQALQAHALNHLADTCANLVKAANDLTQRTADIAERASKGHHLTGFGHDVLGQPGREVQHYASMREALIPTVGGCPPAAIEKALTHTALFTQPFAKGDEYKVEAGR